MSSWWMGVLAGGGLGVAYGVASLLMNRWALRFDAHRAFMIVSLGGLVVRLLGALVVVALTLLFTSIPVTSFVGAFFIIFVLGLALEITILHRAARADEF